MIVLLGDSCSGKSCIRNRYTKDIFEYSEPTVGAAFSIKEVELDSHKALLSLWDVNTMNARLLNLAT